MGKMQKISSWMDSHDDEHRRVFNMFSANNCKMIVDHDLASKRKLIFKLNNGENYLVKYLPIAHEDRDEMLRIFWHDDNLKKKNKKLGDPYNLSKSNIYDLKKTPECFDDIVKLYLYLSKGKGVFSVIAKLDDKSEITTYNIVLSYKKIK